MMMQNTMNYSFADSADTYPASSCASANPFVCKFETAVMLMMAVLLSVSFVDLRSLSLIRFIAIILLAILVIVRGGIKPVSRTH